MSARRFKPRTTRDAWQARAVVSDDVQANGAGVVIVEAFVLKEEYAAIELQFLPARAEKFARDILAAVAFVRRAK